MAAVGMGITKLHQAMGVQQIGNFRNSNYNCGYMTEVNMTDQSATAPNPTPTVSLEEPPVTETPKTPHPMPSGTSAMAVIRMLLLALAWLILIGGIAATVTIFVKSPNLGVPAPLTAWLPWCTLGAAVVIALNCFGLAILVRGQLMQLRLVRFMSRGVDQNLAAAAKLEEQLRKMDRRLDQLDQIASASASASAPATQYAVEAYQSAYAPTTEPVSFPDANSQILSLLTDLRDGLMLSEPQRAQWAADLREKQNAALASDARNAISAGQWKTAEGIIEQIRRNNPDSPLAPGLSEELAASRTETIQQEISGVRENLRHLMSSNAWDQVHQITGALETRYPDDPAVIDLVARTRTEYEAWNRDGRAMLLSEYKNAADHRQWIQACTLAQQILERYPDDKLADKIRSDLTTLRQNAEIQTRRELELQYADLIKRQRHEEAYDVAQRVMEAYPDSSSARELQKHMPKLQELIKQDQARREAAISKP